MTGIIDFSLLEQNWQDIADELYERVSVFEAAIADIDETNSSDVDGAAFVSIKKLPEDLYNIPFALLPSEEVKLEKLEDKYKELVSSYMAKYLLSLIDLNNSLILYGKVQAVIIKNLQKLGFVSGSGFDDGASASKSEVLEYAAYEMQKAIDYQSTINDLITNISYIMSESDIDFPETEGDITKFCKEKEILLSADMDAATLDMLQIEVVSNICQSFNMVADLDVENLDIELGYLHHRGDITAEFLKYKNEIIEGIAYRANCFLSYSRDYLNAAQMHYHTELLVDMRYDNHDLH